MIEDIKATTTTPRRLYSEHHPNPNPNHMLSSVEKIRTTLLLHQQQQQQTPQPQLDASKEIHVYNLEECMNQLDAHVHNTWEELECIWDEVGLHSMEERSVQFGELIRGFELVCLEKVREF